jgi:isoleucyl-tRNA synthetase
LEPFAPVDDEGKFIPPAPEFLIGVRVFSANPLIIEDLKGKELATARRKIHPLLSTLLEV